MKIYTKTGDTGMTSLIGGKIVSKAHQRIGAYGTVDELISWIGMIRDQDIFVSDKETLLIIQDKLMVVSGMLAIAGEANENKSLELGEKNILFLEKEIDVISETLEPLTTFIIPGGHATVSFCHLARSVCRRAEREVIKLNEVDQVNDVIIKYLNRLSDYLFILARKTGKDSGTKEIFWKPGS